MQTTNNPPNQDIPQFLDPSIKGKKAFTLVELIIVITIITILATIAFMSFQGYALQSRDANRLSTLKSIEKGLTIFQTKTWQFPETSSGILITASGWIIIGYQWYVWESVVKVINMNQVPLDPTDNQRYVYATNAQKNKYQLFALKEWKANLVSFASPSYASEDERYSLTIGDTLWIILNSDNTFPIENINTSSGSKNYKLIFAESDNMVASGNILSAIQAYRWDKSLASLDESLVGYWDMETTISSGNLLLLKDWSRYGNHGTCFNSESTVSCWENSVWPHFQSSGWKKGKSMSFDGIDDLIAAKDSPSLSVSGSLTMIAFFKPNTKLENQVARSKLLWKYNDEGWLKSWYSIVNSWGSGNGRLTFTILDESNNNLDNYFTSDYVAPLNQWGFYGWVYNKTDGKSYVFLNGSKINTVNIGVHSISQHIGQPLSIWWSQRLYGIYLQNFDYFHWVIDEVRIYNRALTDAEIQALYTASK